MKTLRLLASLLLATMLLAACGTPAAPDEDEPGLPTIAEIASEDGRFGTLVAALGAAEFVELLSDPEAGPYTVFAPTDDAFAALLEALELEPAELLGSSKLSDILLYHVLDGVVDSGTVVDSAPDRIETLLGQDIEYAVGDDGVVLNGSVNVVITDIEASNGIIHVIDAVLVPTLEYQIDLSGDQEVPAVDTEASGSATVTLDGFTLTVDGTFEGFEIAGPGAHIHGPAAAGSNAGVLHSLEFDNEAGTFGATVELTPAQVGFLLSGRLYLNLHSEANPSGEIRGQIE